MALRAARGADNWENLGTLFATAIRAVHDVDPEIKTVLHLDNLSDEAVLSWYIDSAPAEGVRFDVLGMSGDEVFDGPVADWEPSLRRIRDRPPDMELLLIEHAIKLQADTASEQRENIRHELEMMVRLEGMGAMFWEPTWSDGYWGEGLFTVDEDARTARANAPIRVYDDFASSAE